MSINVVHVMRTYGVHGGERQLAQLFRQNDRSRFADSFHFLYRDDICERYFAAIANLRIEYLLPFRAQQFPTMAKEIIILLLLLPILQLRLIFSLTKGNAKICVAHGLQAGLTCWLAACVMRHVRFIYVHRGTKSRGGSLSIFKILYFPFHAVAGVSQASAKSLQPLMTRGRTAIALDNGIDWQRIDSQSHSGSAEQPRPFTIVAVGRLISGKGQDLIVESFAKFLAVAKIDAQLLFAGDGPDRQRLRDLASMRGVADRTKFLGAISNVAGLLANCDVFVHASETEGLSNAVLEAMAVGIASVVVDAPGVTECHVHGVTGYVTPRNADVVASSLLILSKSPDLIRSLGQNARRRVQLHYSMTANMARYHELYERLLGQERCVVF